MTVLSRSLRTKLLIGASIGSMLLSGVAEAQDRSGSRVFSGRGGGGDPAAAAARAAQSQAQRQAETNSASRRAIETFRRAAETRQSMHDAQAVARAAARAIQSNIPNGLGQGGLQVANGVELDPSLWVGANGPVQGEGENGRTNVSIEQTQQRAILTWDSFNVGRETDLVFNQGGADWVALNRVTGNSADPSQILGSIKADGSVYIINQNGIIFGGASQINVRNLVASTANISNTQFLENGIYSEQTGAGANLRYLPSFTNAGGAVTVEAGAQIATHSPQSVVDGGGYVLLMGTEVRNEGSITAPRGQALLAAGGDFILRPGQGSESNQGSSTRGSELAVAADGGTVTNKGLIESAEGDITMVGKHVVQAGVALATTTVNARGTIHLLTDMGDADASVTLASDSLTMVVPDYDSEFTATDAQRNVLAEVRNTTPVEATGMNTMWAGGATYLLGDRKDLSRIEIRTGGTVDFQSGSQTIATGGQVAAIGLKRIFAADGSLIDVSGSQGVALSMESNNLLVNVQPYELRDSAANRENQALRNNDVWIDVRSLVLVPDGTGGYEGDRYYTPGGLLEVGGHLGNIERGIGEWTATGGTITLWSDEIVAQKGAVFDISGGTLDYQSGYVRSTRVTGADGRLYDISNAPGNLPMAAYGNAFIREHARWGQQYTQVWSDPLFSARHSTRWEQGYSVGRDAGTLTLRAPTVVFESDIIGEVFTGERQTRERPDSSADQFPARTDGYKLPQDVAPLAGRLWVGLGEFDTLHGQDRGRAPYQSTNVIGAGTDITGTLDSTSELSSEFLNRVVLSADDLTRFGLGELRVTGGEIKVEQDLAVAHGGAIRLRAETIDVQADLIARSGVVGLYGLFDASISGSRSTAVTVGEGVMLDTRGLWVNLPYGGAQTDLAFLDGGRIDIRSQRGDIVLASGSLLDASAGGAILLDGSVRGADGGDVNLSTSHQPGQPHRLTLDGTIRSYGSESGVGGTLNLVTSDTIELGGSMLATPGMLGADEPTPFTMKLPRGTELSAGTVLPFDYSAQFPAGTVLTSPLVLDRDVTVPRGTVFGAEVAVQPSLVLEGDFFQQGFSNYSIRSLQDISVAEGATIEVAAPVRRIAKHSPGVRSGATPDEALELWLPPLFQHDDVNGRFIQRAGASISLTASNASTAAGAPPSVGTILVGRDARLVVDDGQSIALDALDSILVQGTLEARGGGISMVSRGAPPTSDNRNANYNASKSLWIDDGAVLDVSGRSVTGTDVLGRRYAHVSGGGTVSLTGSNSYVITRPGAVIDVSGAAAVIDWADRWPGSYGTATIARNGGLIQMQSNYGIVLDAEFRAAAGGEGALGGTLSIEQQGFQVLQGHNLQAMPVPDHVRGLSRIILGQEHVTAAHDDLTFGECIAGCWTPGQTLEESEAANAGRPDLVRQVHLGVDKIKGSGFDSLLLKSADMIVLDGAIDLSLGGTLSLDGMIGSTNADVNSTLSAGYIRFDAPRSLSGTSVHPLATVERGRDGLDRLPVIGEGTLSFNANLMDVGSATFGTNGAVVQNGGVLAEFEYPAWKEVRLFSSGDFRATGGEVSTAGDLTITAAQLYPLTGAVGSFQAGRYFWQRPGETGLLYSLLPGSRLTINRIEGVDSAPPPSLFGRLAFGADIIDQRGIVRAPLGQITLGIGTNLTSGFTASPDAPRNAPTPYTSEVNLHSGSITSVSAAGLVLPYGGTTDGMEWHRNGETATGVIENQGIGIAGSLRADEGSLLDLSGGGTVAGAGFVPGRGGSVDVLSHPLAEISPAYAAISKSGNKVYALMPAHAAAATPVAELGHAQPEVGQQIVIPEGVPGLPAGAYSLLPAEYALLKGAFRVELGAAVSPGARPVTALPDGSFVAMVGTANAVTGERGGQPLAAILTPADVTRTYAQYDETDLATFHRKVPATELFDNPAPTLPEDGKEFILAVTPQDEDSDRPLLTFNGTALFGAAEGGRGGSLSIVRGDSSFSGGLEIVADDATASDGFIAVKASDINAIGASIVLLGGGIIRQPWRPGVLPVLTISSGGGTIPLDPRVGQNFGTLGGAFGTVAVRDGATLTGPQTLLVTTTSGNILVESGATINTIGAGAPAWDATTGYTARTGGNVLAVSNGLFEISTSTTSATGSITVEDGARLYTEGTIAFVTAGSVNLSDNADYGGRYLSLSTGSFNVGSNEALAGAADEGILRAGVALNQSTLDRLMRGSGADGVPAVERLILSAGQSINFYGTIDLQAGTSADAGGASRQLVLNTPALYGHGGAGDTATISAGTLVWNGLETLPGGVIADGPGTGQGTLNIVADTIVLGYQDGVVANHNQTLDRVALGFAAVNLVASDRIVSNSRGTLSVWQRQDVHGEPGTGGALNLVTPVLTGDAGSVMHYQTGGLLRVIAPDGAAPLDGPIDAALGGEVRLSGAGIDVDTAIALPSGRLVLTATRGDVTLGGGTMIDMAGRATEFFDETRYSWGGDVVIESALGDVALASDGRIDLGARHNHAGTLKVTAVNGTVALDGEITAHATGKDDQPDPELRNGGIDVRAGAIAAFADLNRRLTESGVTDSRSFIVKTGDLVIGDELQARNVTVSADGGSLTVNGRIDASGAKPGSIRLSARDDLMLAAGAVLDASASELWVDSYGAPIEAKNRGLVELTSVGGTLTLTPGATIDLSSGDEVARGRVELNAARRGANDVAIQAGGPVTIRGADSIAVNAFRAYEPAGGVINQALLDGIHAESDAFITAAINNTALLNRLAGLTGYTEAFHLRPGVELRSAPGESLSVSGDLNLAGYRYASLNPNSQRTLDYGSGEAGVLLIRAADNLNIFGSITDGFGEPVRTPDDNGWVLYEGPQGGSTNTWPADYRVPTSVTIGTGTILPSGAVLEYSIEVRPFSVAANQRVGATVRVASAYTLDRQWVATAEIRLPDGTVHARGAILPAGTVLPAGTELGAGTVLPTQVSLQAMIWPAGVELPANLTLDAPVQLRPGYLIPRNTTLQFDRISGLLAEPLVTTEPFTLLGTPSGTATTFPNQGTLDFDIVVRSYARVNRAQPIPFEFTIMGSLPVPAYLRPAGWQATANIWDPQGNLMYQAGDWVTRSLDFGTRFAAGSVLPSFYVDSPGPDMPIDAARVAAGTDLSVFSREITLGVNVAVPVGTVLPAGMNVQQAGTMAMRPTQPDGTQGRIWAVAPMLAQGSQSWSMRLVAGADLDSADSRTLRAETELAALGQKGDLVLSDRHYVNPTAAVSDGFSASWLTALARMQNFSVIRTGTGSLDLLAGGGYQQLSLYGVYTAGTPSETIGGNTPDGYNEFNQPRARANTMPNATNPYLGGAVFGGYLPAVEAYQAWYPEHGGDLLLNVQGGIRAYATERHGGELRVGSGSVGNWLWRQGAYGATDVLVQDVPTAWWINFGGYVPNNITNEQRSSTAASNQNAPLLQGFMGIGTLGGGNLTVIAGRDMGVTDSWGTTASGVASSAVNLAVGGTGRVTQVTTSDGRVTGGTLVQTGGGDLTVRIGGALNRGSANTSAGELNGTFVNLRGNIDLTAGSIGRFTARSIPYLLEDIDPRRPDPLNPLLVQQFGGVVLVPGDGTVAVATRGDLVLGGVGDPGRVDQPGGAGVSFGRMQPERTRLDWYWLPGNWAGLPAGSLVDPNDRGLISFCEDYAGQCEYVVQIIPAAFERGAGDMLRTSFSLWRENTSVSLFSAGGDLAPMSLTATANNPQVDDRRFWYPGSLSAVAASGNIYADGGSCGDFTCTIGVLELVPSPNGKLEFLAADSIRGWGAHENSGLSSGFVVAMSGMAWNANDIPNPFRPNWSSNYFRSEMVDVNVNPNGPVLGNVQASALNGLLTFQRDTALGRLYQGERDPMRFYAAAGDVTGLGVGFIGRDALTDVPFYVGAGTVEVRAGRDIVNFGTAPQLGCRGTGCYFMSGAAQMRGLAVHSNPTDISVLSAGRDIIYASMNVAGPGNLVVEAGRDVYQGDRGIFRSIGPLFDLTPETRNGGAGITVLTGVGAGGPDYARFLDLYLNPANLADLERPLGEQNIVNDDGLVDQVQKVAKNYGAELIDWLQARYGYEATDAEAALGFFAGLSDTQQAVFARQVYFDELKAGGREYNDAAGPRFGSYLRGRLAIAALFPEADADGNPMSYAGDFTMFGGSGVRTEFGGDIEILVAGGQAVLGMGGVAPPSSAGVLSMGSGNVDVYSLGSILLGQSRVFTTFGGDILMWAADGDINAGRGAKSTVVYQPPRRVYDDFGNVTLSPPTQNTGAGIATLAPIAEVPPGDVDLIAPLGVIDAGEAGIRVSGDINLAALQVLNAANIDVQGEATGIPMVAAVNTGALTAASNASAAVATQAADLAERSRAQPVRDLPSIITGRVLGFGE